MRLSLTRKLPTGERSYVLEEINTIWAYCIKKSCLTEPSCETEDSGGTAQFSCRKNKARRDSPLLPAPQKKTFHPFTSNELSLLSANISPLSLRQLKFQFKLVLWHTLIEDSMSGWKKTRFQARLSMGELCAPPILSPLPESESISFRSHSWEFNRKLKWIPF